MARGVLKWMGFCKSNGAQVAYGVDMRLALMITFLLEGTHEDPPESVNKEAWEVHTPAVDPRPAVTVIEGSEAFIRKYMSTLTEPDVVMVAAPVEVLDSLGIRVYDRDWQVGSPPLDVTPMILEGIVPLNP